MIQIFRWSWLLGCALIAPTALPAGGGYLRQPNVLRKTTLGPLHTKCGAILQISPMAIAPRLGTLRAGTPLRIIHRWKGDDGSDWLHVQVLVGEEQRGWVRA